VAYLLPVQSKSLAEIYSSKTDGELIVLAADAAALVDEARPVLADELLRRNIMVKLSAAVRSSPKKDSGAVKLLRLVGSLLINLTVAVIGTGILDTEVRQVIPTHTVAAGVWKEIILSIVCAAFVGFFMWRTWRSSAAKWIWILAALWFVFGYLTIARSANPWGRLSGFSSGSVLSGPDVRTFFVFTVPFIRAIFYSVGAYISSLMQRARVSLPDGC
jgi:hypothetical protein